MTQCLAAKPDRSSSAIAKSNLSLHSDVTEALALSNKTQQAESRQRIRAQRSYTSRWLEKFMPLWHGLIVRVAIKTSDVPTPSCNAFTAIDLLLAKMFCAPMPHEFSHL